MPFLIPAECDVTVVKKDDEPCTVWVTLAGASLRITHDPIDHDIEVSVWPVGGEDGMAEDGFTTYDFLTSG